MLQSTSLLRGKTFRNGAQVDEDGLQSTSLLRGKTPKRSAQAPTGPCFNPLPSCEGRHFPFPKKRNIRCFNPLPSCEGRPFAYIVIITIINASIHFPLAREDHHLCAVPGLPDASIHFPLAREDLTAEGEDYKFKASIHFPLAREDSKRILSCGLKLRFNPLPSCEGRHYVDRTNQVWKSASIHFPLAREDPKSNGLPENQNASIHFPLAREDWVRVYRLT